MNMIQGKVIWDLSNIADRDLTRIEFPSLVRFRNHWYCGFREAEIHMNHPSGRGRIIRSADGGHWETALLLAWDGGDVREPKFSITPEGWLMVNTSVCFVSREPRADDPASPEVPRIVAPTVRGLVRDARGSYFQLDTPGTPADDAEPNVARQSVNWLSPDGVHWSSAYACSTGINTWRWDVTWHDGMGYSIAYGGTAPGGVLYRTRDGKSWRALKAPFFPPGDSCSEGALAFDARTGSACCLLRGSSRTKAYIGVGKPPYYQIWAWKRPFVDYGAELGGARPAEDALGTVVGGPKLIQLRDGRLVAAARALGPGRQDGRATLFWIDPETAVMTAFAEFDGTSYPGLAEHEGKLWVTYIGSACHRETWEVRLAGVPIKRAG